MQDETMATAAADESVGNIRPTFAPLVAACARYGTGRTSAFKLAREGNLDVFHIGARAFVRLASLETLPERLASQQVGARNRD